MRGTKLRSYVRYLPLYGCISTAMIYFGIGTVAILSFLKLKEGGADETSLLAFMNEYILGKLFVWAILIGTVAYVIWRIYEAITDPYDYGSTAMGLSKRIGIAASTVADILIAYSAILILLGASNVRVDGNPEQDRQMVQDLLGYSWGSAVVVLIGGIIFMSAVVQLFYGTTRGYKERLDIAHFSVTMKRLIHVLGLTGYVARGIILGIVGFFFAKAGVLKDHNYVVNTDKAFDFIGDEIGHASFILVAAGTICYAFFMVALGLTYDADKD
jgi:hypothetical protein